MKDEMQGSPPKPLPQKRKRNSLGCAIVIAMILFVGCFGLLQFFNPHEAAPRMKASNDLKQLAISMHMYESAHGHFPGANAPFLGPEGNGKQYPVSWRVLLLTYVYDDGHGVPILKYRFDEPLDGPNNVKLIDQIPKIYRHPMADQVPNGYTHYRVLASRPGAKPSAFFTDGLPGPIWKEIPDGSSNTFLIVEAVEAVPWTMPEVLLYDRDEPLPKLGGLFKSRFLAANADGNVHTFKNSLSEEQIRARITKDGGEKVEE